MHTTGGLQEQKEVKCNPTPFQVTHHSPQPEKQDHLENTVSGVLPVQMCVHKLTPWWSPEVRSCLMIHVKFNNMWLNSCLAPATSPKPLHLSTPVRWELLVPFYREGKWVTEGFIRPIRTQRVQLHKLMIAVSFLWSVPAGLNASLETARGTLGLVFRGLGILTSPHLHCASLLPSNCTPLESL